MTNDEESRFLDEDSGIRRRKKHQHPSSKHQRSTKLRTPNTRFEAWFLKFLWSLDVGAWSFGSRLLPLEGSQSSSTTLIAQAGYGSPGPFMARQRIRLSTSSGH